MITEILIAVAYTFVAIIAWKGITNQTSVNIVRSFLAGAVLCIALIEIVAAVDLAVTSTSDIGHVRKVGIPAIVAAIYAMWRLPKWTEPKPKEA